MSWPHQDDAIHLFGFVSKELLHAHLIRLPLKLHINWEGWRLHVTIGSSQQHPYVIYGTRVAIANVYNNTGIFRLLKSDLPSFILRLKGDVGFGNQQLLLVKIACKFDCRSVCRFGECVIDRLMNPVYASVTNFFINNQFLFWPSVFLLSIWDRLLCSVWVSQVAADIWARNDWRHEIKTFNLI